MEAIKSRRSIRKYKPDPVPPALIEGLLEAARLAPSASNIQSWKFKVITDLQTRKELRSAARNQKFVEKAPVVIACCADYTTFKEATRRAIELVARGAARPNLEMALMYLRKESKDAEAARVLLHAVMNVTIAVQQMVLAATDMGLGTCWIRAFDEARASEILGLSAKTPLVALLTVGYPDEHPRPRPRRSLEEIRL